MGSANCPTVAVTDHVPDPVALQQVFDNPNCFSFQEVFPGGFTPQMGGTAADASLAGGVRGATAGGLDWDISGSVGLHTSDLFIRDTVNGSLGPASPTAFDVGTNRQRELNLHVDVSHAVTERINVAAGAEWRDEQFRTVEGDRAGWLVGPYAGQRFMAGANGFFGYGPLHAGAWSRYNVAAYGDLEVTDPEDAWTLGGAVRVENFEDFGTTTNGKVSGRLGFVRGSVSSGFRAPTPGQQNGFNISSWFDPTIGDSGQQRRHSVHLAGRAAPRRPAAGAGAVDQLHGRRGARHRLLHADGRLLPHRRVRPDRDYEQLLPDRRGGRGPGGRRIRRRGERQELPLLHQRLRHLLAGHRRRLHVHAARPAREHDHQRRLQPHRHAGDRQRQGTARRPAARRVPPTRCRAPAGTSASRSASDRPACSAASATTAAGTTTTADTARSSPPPGASPRASSPAGPSSIVEVGFPLGEGATLAVGGRNLFDVYSQVSAIAMSVGERYSEYTPWGLQRRLLLRAHWLRLGQLSSASLGGIGDARWSEGSMCLRNERASPLTKRQCFYGTRSGSGEPVQVHVALRVIGLRASAVKHGHQLPKRIDILGPRAA